MDSSIQLTLVLVTSVMTNAGESFRLGRTIGRKRNAMSTTVNRKKEESEESPVKCGLPDDRLQPGRILRQKPDKEEVCVTPVKPSHVFSSGKTKNSAEMDFSSLPFDVLVRTFTLSCFCISNLLTPVLSSLSHHDNYQFSISP